MTDRILLNNAFAQNLLTIRKTQMLIDRTMLRLATGLDVNTALDNPQNYFQAQSLKNRAGDLAKRLDGIGTGIQTIKEGLAGAQAIENLLRLSESTILEELERFREFGPLPAPPPIITTIVAPPAATLDAEILSDSPAAYWRLNEAAGITAANSGSIGGAVNGIYNNGPALNSAPLYAGGGGSVDFNGTNQFVSIPDNAQINTAVHTQRSVELIFNADTTAGRQVLYEEGGGTDALAIYIFAGRIYVTGRDNGAWGPVDISAPIVAGQSYHVAFTFDSGTGQFIGYLDGVQIGSAAVTAPFPAHASDIGIGSMRQGTWFHDGAGAGDDFYYNGRISDVALYNTALTPFDIASHAFFITGVVPTASSSTPSIRLDKYDVILDQITQLSRDAGYLGVNLLGGDDITTLFNENGSSKLLTEGADFTAEGLGILRSGFETEEGVLNILQSIRDALEDVRRYSASLSVNLNILTIREDFTRGAINGLLAGAQDLTIADTNEEGANLLALQTRQALSTTVLSMAAQFNGRVLDLFA